MTGTLAPAACVGIEECVSPGQVALVGRDLEGRIRVRVELSREDATRWWGRTIRLWLTMRYGTRRIRLLG